MMLKMVLAGTMGMAVAGIAGPAMAAPATVTVTGTVLSGFDAVGTFGTAGASLAGLPFSAIFTVDPSRGDTRVQTGTLNYLFGRGAASPVSAALTIGSGTYNFAGSYSGTARATNGAGKGGTDSLMYMVEDTNFALSPPDNTLFYVSFDTLRDLLGSADFTNASVVNLTTADNAKGDVRITNRNAATGTYGPTTFADLSVTSIRAQAMSAVPEPATWAMMVAGFAVAGVALRRGRRVQARVRFA
ncbi:PEPxxWA-CTERM sorting domain-containing protein [Sphingomonas endophytica]|uniref:Ice-binding protein C-terminal domain-containing protein n=1 Tax=Sphingomonas endophytica TaxID=869719 RepID=A0A147I9T7_9SPHN|nr:PEPxxWA-CTERM sorting domain-containing protein [Sphingomonas endophytica]KTT76360.1 hypothetical protein NS334_01085 [Sphingomonas endophytica]